MTTCTFCGLATPDPPVTDEEVAGEYCCRGCLEVASTLDDPATGDAEAVRNPSEPSSEEPPTPATVFLDVDGMHCATCETYLEGRALGIEGVGTADASYAAELMRVGYDPNATSGTAIATEMSGAGYHAAPADSGAPEAAERELDTESRLLVGAIFGVMAMMWYVLFLYPTYLGVSGSALLVDVEGPAGTYVLAAIGVMSTAVLGYTGRPLFQGAWVSLRAGRPNVDLLIALAAGTAYAYSLVALAIGRTEVYFDVAIVIVVVVTVGRHYERRVRDGAGAALAELAAANVDDARRRSAGTIETVTVDALDEEDEVIVRAGERIPVDGTVIEGRAAVDESLVTGEATPVRREPGDTVVGGSMATDGRLVIAPDVDGESTLDRLVEVLWDVQSRTTGAQRLADRLAAVFVPLVVIVATSVVGIQLLGDVAPPNALLTGLAVLVVSCPCALGLATPLAVARGIQTALDRGIVLTDRAAVERVASTEVVALDKTGTLTTGRMTVQEVTGPPPVLARAAAVEQYADHPIAEAITAAAESPPPSVADFERYPGRGAAGTVGDCRVVVGQLELLRETGHEVPARLTEAYETTLDAGEGATCVGWDGAVRGVIRTTGELRDGWRGVVAELAAAADRAVVLTGDTTAATERISSHGAIDEVFAELPPEGKARAVERLAEDNRVAMIGDGNNDAPALATADVGIALGSGTDLAGDAADAVIVSDALDAVPDVFAVTAATRSRIRQNLGWAFCYNGIAIPIAAAGLLNPLFAALAMATSSLLVVGNSTRALRSVEDGPGSDTTATRGHPDPSGAPAANGGDTE